MERCKGELRCSERTFSSVVMDKGWGFGSTSGVCIIFAFVFPFAISREEWMAGFGRASGVCTIFAFVFPLAISREEWMADW